MNVELTIKGEVSVLRLRPGDRIIATVDGHCAPWKLERISEVLREQFPDNQVIVLCAGLRLAVEEAA